MTDQQDLGPLGLSPSLWVQEAACEVQVGGLRLMSLVAGERQEALNSLAHWWKCLGSLHHEGKKQQDLVTVGPWVRCPVTALFWT